MPVLLLVLASAIVAIGFYRRGVGLRQSLVFATIPVSLFLVFSTEGLSVFHGIAKIEVELCWLGFAIAGFLWMRRQRDDNEGEVSGLPLAHGLRKAWRDLGTADRVMLGLTGLIAGLVALTALLSAPNTWDAMEYHMPRVVEWIGNRGLQLYPTIDHQQLSMPPFSEYLILHLQLLVGSDRFANMVQWMAYAGCMLVASLIARELGGDRRAQVLAVVVSATIETGILGASGAKNDYVLAYWVAASVFLLLRWKARQSWALTLAIGSALSLAVFSKGTAYAFLPPLVVFCFFLWGWPAQKKFLLRLPVLALICVAISGPLWARNYEFSGSVLGLPYFDGAGPNEGRMYGNGHITPARSAANVIRNLGLNMAVPGQKLNNVTVKALSRVIRLLGVDPDDYYQLVHSQSGPMRPFNIEFHPFSETQSGNQLHFALLIAAGVLCLWKRRLFDRQIAFFACGIVCSFVLYATLLRWSPWNARYQLPVFVLGAVFTAIVLVRVLPRSAQVAIACVLLLFAFPLTIKNSSRALYDRTYSVVSTPRERTYFYDNHWEYADSFIQAAKAAAAKNCNSIGIDANQLHFEYPMMALLNRDGQPRRLSYVAVHNSTEDFKQADLPEPCTVICLSCAHAEQESGQFRERFKNVESYGDILVFSNAAGSVADSAGAKASAGL